MKGHKFLLVGGVIAVAALAEPALASEGNNFGGPLGGTDARAAYIPSNSGWHGGFVLGGGTADRLYGDNEMVRPNTSVSEYVVAYVVAGAASLTYVYPFKLFGGSLASSAQVLYQTGHLGINQTQSNFGSIADSYVQLLGWSNYVGPLFGRSDRPTTDSKLPYGLTVKAAYSMTFPVGDYTPDKLFTNGHNIYLYIPNVAFTYLTYPNAIGDGLELSSATFLHIASYNDHTHYQNRSIVDVEFAATERWGRWQAGLGGYWAKQLDDDKQNDVLVQPNGKKLYAIDLGLVIVYDIPDWKATVKFKVQLPITQSNYVNVQRELVSITRAF